MGVFAADNKQQIYLYSEDSWLGKNLLPYIVNQDKPVRVININKETITTTIWIEIASLLEVDLEQMFDPNYLILNEAEDDWKYHAGDWLKLVNKNPGILQSPIAINGVRAKILQHKKELFKFYNLTRADFEKFPSLIRFAEHNSTSGFQNIL